MGGAIDLRLDWPNNTGLFHEAFETAVFSLAHGAVAYLWAGWMRTRRSLTLTVEVSDRLRQERDARRHRAEKLLRGLCHELPFCDNTRPYLSHCTINILWLR